MKKNQKGFMLFETLVVSTFVLGTLIFIYIQFTNIKRNYEVSFKYNPILEVYYAKNMANFLTYDGYNSILEELNNSENGFVDITNCVLSSGTLCVDIKNNIDVKTILFTTSNISKLKIYSKSNNNNFSEEFKKFINFIPENSKNEQYRIIIEFNNGKFIDITVGKDKTL